MEKEIFKTQEYPYGPITELVEIEDEYEHIKGNKEDSKIKDKDCIKAIKMIQKYVEKTNLIKQLYPNRK